MYVRPADGHTMHREVLHRQASGLFALYHSPVLPYFCCKVKMPVQAHVFTRSRIGIIAQNTSEYSLESACFTRVDIPRNHTFFRAVIAKKTNGMDKFA